MSPPTRQQAVGTGLPLYFGKPCLYGHDGWRYANDSHCVECRPKKDGPRPIFNRAQVLRRRGEWRDNNRDKVRKHGATFYSKNKVKVKASNEDAKLKRRYGITLADYTALSLKQNGKCAICDKSDNGGHKLAVDHCHRTGKLRALLCHMCNKNLGIFEKNRDRFASYLRTYGHD